MRKISKLISGILVGLAIIVAGCSLTNEQVEVIAQNTGLGAAVTWIAYDNPDTNAIDLVEGVLDIIYDKSGSVQTGVTYTATLYPIIEEFATSGAVPHQYKPVVLAGSLSMLNGIDLLFALNPEWKTSEGLALKVVKAFCLGAKQGLSLTEKDAAIIQARSFAVQRRELGK